MQPCEELSEDRHDPMKRPFFDPTADASHESQNIIPHDPSVKT